MVATVSSERRVFPVAQGWQCGHGLAQLALRQIPTVERARLKAVAQVADRFEAVVLGVSDLAASEAMLRQRNISFENRSNRLIVPPAEGQGTTLIMEQA